MSVDLPAPFSPTTAWISPALTVRLTLSSALTPGNVLVMLRMDRMVSSATPSPEFVMFCRVRSPERGWRLRASGLDFDMALLDLRFRVVAAVNQDRLPVGAIHQYRVEQIRRHHLHAVVVGL